LGLKAIHFLDVSTRPRVKQYKCLEAGCGRTFVAENDDELVQIVQRHVHESHGSVELEEVILSGATPVDETVARDE
jgi:predicted small metal-binding protein